MTAVMGNFHQATNDKFKHAATGSQCCSNCITALIASKVKSVHDWDSNFVDDILLAGDSLHLNILQKKGWPFRRAESRLNIDELPEKIAALVEAIFWLVLGFWMRQNLHFPHTSTHL